MAIVPISKEATTTCVSILDAAIDFERCAKLGTDKRALYEQAGRPAPVLEYLDARWSRPASWRDLMAFKDGARPTEFIIGVIPAAELSRIEDECGLGTDHEKTRELCWRCFLVGLRDLLAGPTSEITTADGARAQGVPKKKVDGVEYVDPEWLSRVFVGPLRSVALEIGRVVWNWNQLGPADVKN